MFSGFRMYFILLISHFSDSSSVPVVLLLVFVVCGVIIGVLSVYICFFVLRFVDCVVILVVC
jgi:hypothetical protein